MGACETRFCLLAGLAWELRAIPVTTLLVIPGRAEPVLYVACPYGRMEAVLAVRAGVSWALLWRGRKLSADRLPVAARQIALEAAA